MNEIFSEVPLAFQGTHFFLTNCLKNFWEPQLLATGSGLYVMLIECVYSVDMYASYRRDTQPTPSGKELRLGEVLQINYQEKVYPLEYKRHFRKDLVHGNVKHVI